MNATQNVAIHSQTALTGVQQNIRQGDLLFVRVMKNLGGGNYLASFAGGRFTVKSAADLIAGQTFRARVEIANGKLLLVPQMQGANGANQNAAISVQNFSALSPEVAAFLASMGLEADGVAERILQFLMQSGAKINPSLMQKARRLASKYKGQEATAAEAALVLEQKGIDSEDALDEIMSLLQGEGERGKDTGAGNRQQEQATASSHGEQQDHSSEVEVTSLDKVLDEFNSLPQKNTDYPNKSWLLVPFEFNISGNSNRHASVAEGEQDNNFHLRNRREAAEQGQEVVIADEAPAFEENLPTSYSLLPTGTTGTGVLRLFIDTEKNVTEKCVINFKFSGKNLFFVVYYKDKKAAALNFSGEGLDLDSAELKAGIEGLGASLGEGVAAKIIPFQEFSEFATENLPFSSVEGFA